MRTKKHAVVCRFLRSLLARARNIFGARSEYISSEFRSLSEQSPSKMPSEAVCENLPIK